VEVSSEGVLIIHFPNLVLHLCYLGLPMAEVLEVLNIIYLAVLRKGSLALFLAEVNKSRNIINMDAPIFFLD
jgi:hypothetical protein